MPHIKVQPNDGRDLQLEGNVIAIKFLRLITGDVKIVRHKSSRNSSFIAYNMARIFGICNFPFFIEWEGDKRVTLRCAYRGGGAKLNFELLNYRQLLRLQ